MDREDIIKMAREAGLAYGSDEKPLGSVIRFAALVAAAERESVAASSKRDLTCVCGAVWEGEQMVHAPRKREWVGLTDEEISAVDWKPNETLHDYARHIELKLRGKNT